MSLNLEFIADMNISPLTVEQLRKLGWNIIRVTEIMDKKSKDTEILDYARKNNKIIITRDLDFSMLLALAGYDKPSVINLRFDNGRPEFATGKIVDVVSEMEKELERGIIISVDNQTLRYRNLPV